MTLRKPGGTTWDSWIDQQIAHATRKGEFTTLKGHGKPLNLNKQYDEDWWIKQKMVDESLDMAPLTLRVRRKTETWLNNCIHIYSEKKLIEEATQLNHQIERANAMELGPLLPQQKLDIEDLLQKWRANH